MIYIFDIFQIFDEILVNAADNKQRDPKMDTIKIDIKPEENLIKVILWNKGVWGYSAVMLLWYIIIRALYFCHLLDL